MAVMPGGVGRGAWARVVGHGAWGGRGRVNGARFSGTKRPQVSALVVARPVDDLWRHPVRSADDSAVDVESLLQGRDAKVCEFDPACGTVSTADFLACGSAARMR